MHRRTNDHATSRWIDTTMLDRNVCARVPQGGVSYSDDGFRNRTVGESYPTLVEPIVFGPPDGNWCLCIVQVWRATTRALVHFVQHFVVLPQLLLPALFVFVFVALLVAV